MTITVNKQVSDNNKQVLTEKLAQDLQPSEKDPIRAINKQIEDRRKSCESAEMESEDKKEGEKGGKINRLASLCILNYLKLVVNIGHLTTELFEELNFIRNNPKEFAKVVENHIHYINVKDNCFVYEHPDYKENLNRGAEAFYTCIEDLKKHLPLRKFEYEENVKVVVPDKLDDQEHKTDDLLREIVEKFPEKKIEFFYNFVYPKVECILVMLLVDDNIKGTNFRRKLLLSDVYKNLGISIKKAKGKQFCLYLTFSV